MDGDVPRHPYHRMHGVHRRGGACSSGGRGVLGFGGVAFAIWSHRGSAWSSGLARVGLWGLGGCAGGPTGVDGWS